MTLVSLAFFSFGREPDQKYLSLLIRQVWKLLPKQLQAKVYLKGTYRSPLPMSMKCELPHV